MSNLNVSILEPAKKLKGIVRRILITESNGEVKEKLPIGPTGFSYFTYSRYPVKLVFSDKKIESDKQLYLAGQLENEQPYFDIEGQFFHIGLEMLPTAPSYFFGIDASIDGGVILENVDFRLSNNFRKKFAEEQNPEKVAMGLEDVILNKIPDVNSNKDLDRALQIIYENSGHIGISQLAKEADISERHLRRIFRQIVGLGPKQYCKIIQFNAAFEALQIGDEKRIFSQAMKSGYYDQAHFINDFKAMLGQSPMKFLKSDHQFLKQYLGSV